MFFSMFIKRHFQRVPCGIHLTLYVMTPEGDAAKNNNASMSAPEFGLLPDFSRKSFLAVSASHTTKIKLLFINTKIFGGDFN